MQCFRFYRPSTLQELDLITVLNHHRQNINRWAGSIPKHCLQNQEAGWICSMGYRSLKVDLLDKVAPHKKMAWQTWNKDWADEKMEYGLLGAIGSSLWEKDIPTKLRKVRMNWVLDWNRSINSRVVEGICKGPCVKVSVHRHKHTHDTQYHQAYPVPWSSVLNTIPQQHSILGELLSSRQGFRTRSKMTL